MFDPEKVKRWDLYLNHPDSVHPGGMAMDIEKQVGCGDYVLASDYDALLKLYRVKEQRLLDLATLFGVCDGGRYLEDWKTKAALLKQ